MAKEISVNLNIDGVTVAAKNLNDLTAAISTLKSELDSATLGSDKFNILSANLQKAQSELKTFEKQFEGLEPQQKTEAFTKFGEGIAGAFAIGTNAAALFGQESKNVERIQTAAQQAIAISIGARQISEGILQASVLKKIAIEKLSAVVTNQAAAAEAKKTTTTVVSTVATEANVVATEAQVVATGSATVAQRLLNIVMAANPVFLLIGGIAALVGAFVLFSDSADDAAAAQDAFNESVERGILAAKQDQIFSEKIITNNQLQLDLLRARKAPLAEIQEQERLLLNSQKEAAETNLNNAIIVQANLQKEIDRLDKVTDRTEDQNKALKDLNKTLGEQKLEVTKLGNEYETFGQKTDILNANQANTNEEANKKIAEDNKRAFEEKKRKQEEASRKRLDIERKLSDELLKLGQNDLKNEEARINNEFNLVIDGLGVLTAADRQARIDAEVKKNNDLLDVKKSQIKIDFELAKNALLRQYEDIEGNSENEIKLRQAINDQIVELEQKKDNDVTAATQSATSANNKSVENGKKTEADIIEKGNDVILKLEKETNDLRTRNFIESIDDKFAKEKAIVINTFNLAQQSAEDTLKADQKNILATIEPGAKRDKALLDAKAKYDAAIILSTTERDEQLAQIEDDSAQARLDKVAQYTALIGQTISGVADSVNGLLQQITDNQLANLDAQTAATEESYDAQIEAAKKAGKSTEDLEKKKAAFQAQQEKVKKEIEKKAFQRNKAFQVANAIINTAVAVTSALAQPVGGPFLAIAAGIAGAAEIATILAQQFNGDSPAGSAPSGGGAPSIPATQIPTVPVNPNTEQNLTGASQNETLGNLQPLQVNVSISESEITGIQTFNGDLSNLVTL
jgi:hypothetical protein